MKLKQLGFAVLLLELIFTGINAQLNVCGMAPLNTRIVGGQDANLGDWPWQAIVRPGNSLCGGSLISSQWVLTAAHCFGSTSTAGLSVSFGRLTIFGSGGVNLGVSEVIIHPDYNQLPNDNDVALLKLSSPVDFTDVIRPVCLAAEDSVISSGTQVWVTGYGTTSSGGSLAQSLQEVNVPIVSDSQCNISYSGRITANMICAGNEGRDSCQGDSGGPMVFKKDSRWTQTGVVSFGIGCGDASFPGVYARVSRFQAWISQNIPFGEQPGFISLSNTATTPGSSNGGLTAVFLSVPLLMSIFPIVFSVFCLS